MDAPPDEAGGPRYVVVDRPGPWLVIVADRHTGKTELWSRSLRGGTGRHSRHGAPIPCASCGREIVGPFYRRTHAPAPTTAHLCLACVEGADG
jgi:hypothetical protein